MIFRSTCLLLATCAVLRGGVSLENAWVRAEFNDRGLTALVDKQTGQTLRLERDAFSFALDGQTIDSERCTAAVASSNRRQRTYGFTSGTHTVRVVYELRPDWRFVSKQLVYELPPNATSRVTSIEMLQADLITPVAFEHKASRGSGAVFLRLVTTNPSPTFGAFLALQNPFLKWERHAQCLSISYAPDLEWRASFGPFRSDRLCLGLYALSGLEMPARALREWQYVPEPERAFDALPKLDQAEFEAVTRCVEAFTQVQAGRSLRVHVPWCENDYQIDVATPAGRAEWKRIVDQCAAIGCRNTLFTPANSAVATLADNADAWGWENLLWLGLGQKIRRGEWNITSDPIPPSIQEMLDYARSRRVKLLAYVYPTLAWKQNPEWTAWIAGQPGGYLGADTGVRSFQDWFVDQLVAFQKRTGIAGYSFDHWWIAYETKDGHRPTSPYAQWFGCRRILEELRRRCPDVIIDGRQQYQWFGPWTWLAGSYPHPTTNDEQPGSFENFPDLHFSRVSGNRQRWATWFYHQEQFAPWELVPGYLTHQTPRNNAQGQCVRDRPFHVRDWDYLGWRYSVLSSIGTAPFNHVVNLLPARDEIEFKHFQPEDQRWLRHWMDWTDRHRATLKHLRPILGPPTLGRVDGTAALSGDRGFVFLFNPNYRDLTAEFVLDARLGLTGGQPFVFRELYPRPGRLHGRRPLDGAWRPGDTIQFPIKGPQAVVLELLPASRLPRPALLNVEGRATLKGHRLVLEGVVGEPGRRVEATVLLPDRPVDAVVLNGVEVLSYHQNPGALSFPIAFAGPRFDHCHQVGEYDRNFTNTVFRASFTVPPRVFAQLEARLLAWPVPYTNEELLATWRGSDRLLLYLQIADPDDRWPVGLKLDGQPVEVRKAYSDVFPLGRERTFTGFYADLSHLRPDTRYEVEVTLPPGLALGQFQGLFFENVEAEYTNIIRE